MKRGERIMIVYIKKPAKPSMAKAMAMLIAVVAYKAYNAGKADAGRIKQRDCQFMA
jgi:hypothetical protein